jgi:hypothetical protein
LNKIKSRETKNFSLFVSCLVQLELRHLLLPLDWNLHTWFSDLDSEVELEMRNEQYEEGYKNLKNKNKKYKKKS